VLVLGGFAFELLQRAAGGGIHGLRELLGLAAVAGMVVGGGAFAVALCEAILLQLFEPGTYDHDLTFLKIGAALGLLAAGSVASITAEPKPKRRLARSRR
jgi:hypothetical protein